MLSPITNEKRQVVTLEIGPDLTDTISLYCVCYAPDWREQFLLAGYRSYEVYNDYSADLALTLTSLMLG